MPKTNAQKELQKHWAKQAKESQKKQTKKSLGRAGKPQSTKNETTDSDK